MTTEPSDGRPSVPNTMAQLYQINDVLTSLALELGVNVTEQWEDDVLNDLTLKVGEAMGINAPTDVRPPVPHVSKLTMSEAERASLNEPEHEDLQVYMTHDVVIAAFKRWVASQGWELSLIPRFGEDDSTYIPTHMIVPAGLDRTMQDLAALYRRTFGPEGD